MYVYLHKYKYVVGKHVYELALAPVLLYRALSAIVMTTARFMCSTVRMQCDLTVVLVSTW